MNERCRLEVIREDIDDPLQRLVVERTERVVDEHPWRLLQHHAGKRDAELFILAQFPIPPSRHVE